MIIPSCCEFGKQQNNNRKMSDKPFGKQQNNNRKTSDSKALGFHMKQVQLSQK